MTPTDNALLITGARVYTADRDNPWAEAVAVQGNTIAAVGDEQAAREAAGPEAEEIHIPGGLVVPGLNDSHIHMTGGAYALSTLNLEGITDIREVQSRLREYATRNPNREWIEAYGLLYEPMSGLDRPEREVLDEAVPDRPVLISAMDFHSAWVNSEALRRAGIERGADVPRPNEVVVGTDGLATGMLKESLATRLVATCIPAPTAEDRDNQLCHAMRYLNRLGITSVQNMDADVRRLQQYDRLLESGNLTLRANHYMSVREETPIEYLDDVLAFTETYSSPWNHTNGIKLFIDGVVEAKTAWMIEPYADGSADIGIPDIDPEVYRRVCTRAGALDLDIATHAIGDRGVHTALNAYSLAAAAASRGDRRDRIEHIEVSLPADWKRFHQMGVVASMQPLHAAPGADPTSSEWTKLVGPKREPYAFAWRSLADSGATLSFGSDWPVVTPDVRIGLHTALTRRNVLQQPSGGWQTQQAVTLAQALDAYTRGAAWVERQEHVKGRLLPGMLADITTFERDLFTLAPEEILTTNIALTVLDGRVLHRTL